jgi:hypothetical protein
MSRIRTIKPGFFRNELLAECDPLARILFAGLWTEADRDGRLEDRPRRLKVELLPYDDCDIDALLDQLDDKGFIIRYTISGDHFIAIPKWYEHQRPHHKEASNGHPAPPKMVEKRRDLQESREKERASTQSGTNEPAFNGDNGDNGNGDNCTPPTPPQGGVKVTPFATYWSIHPKKTEVKRARNIWTRLSEEHRLAAIAGARKLAAAVANGEVEVRYVPGGAVFLNERWAEWEDGTPEHLRHNGDGKPSFIAGLRQAYEETA